MYQGSMMSEDISRGLESSSSPSGTTTTTECMLAAACSSRAGPPLMERRLRPPHEQNLNCPRCDSTHTKFCYYNNYSLSQPRYFCKTCRRYWTKGGTLRNIPVGGGCRKNKKSSSKKSNDQQNQPILNQHGGVLGSSSACSNPIDLHLSFPHHQVQFPHHLANLIGAQMSSLGEGSFMDHNGGGGGGGLIRPIDFMESKYDNEGLVGGGSRGHDFMGNNATNGSHQFGLMGDIGGYNTNPNTSFGGIYSSSLPFDGNNPGISFMDQRLLLPFDGINSNDHHHHHHQSGVDVKPNPKLLSLEWQHQGCTTTTSDNAAKDPSYGGYNMNGTTLNSWSGLMGGFQSPTTNSLV